MDRGEGERRLLHLPHGVSVWLCAEHRSAEFQTRRSGRDLIVSLAWAWDAAGCLGASRQRALAALERRSGSREGGRSRPGSYAWPALRREAERRFSKGEPPVVVIHDLRASAVAGPAVAPSVRTMRRWFAEGRWLRTDGATAEPLLIDSHPGSQGSPSREA
jgi:hypothetical protein